MELGVLNGGGGGALFLWVLRRPFVSLSCLSSSVPSAGAAGAAATERMRGGIHHIKGKSILAKQ